jgi:3D (Asp-Asp-Asp) domain-containing protein
MPAQGNRRENAAIWHKRLSRSRAGPPHKVAASVTVLPLVRALIRSRTTQIAAAAALCAMLGTSGALGAASRNHTGGVAARGQDLAGQAHRALLDVYSLDSRLAAARTRVASLEAAALHLRRERIALRDELGAARSTLAVSQHQLAVRLRAVYEQGSIDPVAVVLGSPSLGAGLQKLDYLTRDAEQSRAIATATRAAHLRLLHARRTLGADARRLSVSLASARAAEQSLATAVASRTAYVASLRSRVGQTQVSGIVATADAAERKSRELAPPSAGPEPGGGRKLVVSATCYDLSGRTATGMPVGWGVVAVDPNVIRLGTKLYIPGYGKGVAADVGGGIKGAIIDLWMPWSKCKLWGRRTVTITVY